MGEKYTHIIEGCLRYDRDAMRELYETTAPMAMGVCMRYCKNREDAQDALQDGYVKIYENLRHLQHHERLMAWVYRVMVNECVSRSLAKRRWLQLEYVDREVSSPFADPFANEEIVLAMQRLPERPRVVFNLMEVEGQTAEEVAKYLRTDVENVKSSLSKARKLLREILVKR